MNKNLVKVTLALTIIGSLGFETGVYATSFESEGTKVTVEQGKPLVIEHNGEKKVFNNGQSTNYDPNIKAHTDGAYSVEYTDKGQVIKTDVGTVELDNNGSYRVKDSTGKITEEKNSTDKKNLNSNTEDQILKEVREVKKIVKDKPKIIEKPVIVEKSVNNVQEAETIEENTEDSLAMGTISFIAKVPEGFNRDITVKFNGDKYEDSVILNKQNNYYFSKPLPIGTYSVVEIKTEKNDDLIKYDANVLNVYADQDTKKNITVELPKSSLEETLKKDSEVNQTKKEKNKKGIIFPVIVVAIIGGCGFFIYKNKDKLLYKDQF
ncbi:hypothetical protein SAMN00017477_0058 [Peptoniphilus asaccharolyticus DSM 20463]|uniref:Uncharacterized protein n=1 Tax=Peptoniphilus asaccharolyticus DSM 20463 TaxID=573058 RepID=A0A1W1UCK8_PEPAS|nr:hypothetical protein [Peptoniphilus asaccharolyticus]MBL7576443.1 hypothetical protein [Peptoniphilus asaccharolyticus]SMB78524.1 hypothetical protein SAMN00017477_0058 [Peptoniphilus asaccharolyticus DSM 20463]